MFAEPGCARLKTGKAKSMDISFIRQAVASNRYEISQHADKERRNDDLSFADIENAIETGKIIELYPNDPRGPSCLVFGRARDGRPIHLAIGFLPCNWVRIITVYIPDPEGWGCDWATRRRG